MGWRIAHSPVHMYAYAYVLETHQNRRKCYAIGYWCAKQCFHTFIYRWVLWWVHLGHMQLFNRFLSGRGLIDKYSQRYLHWNLYIIIIRILSDRLILPLCGKYIYIKKKKCYAALWGGSSWWAVICSSRKDRIDFYEELTGELLPRNRYRYVISNELSRVCGRCGGACAYMQLAITTCRDVVWTFHRESSKPRSSAMDTAKKRCTIYWRGVNTRWVIRDARRGML